MCWVRLGQILRFEIRLGWSNWKWKDNAWIGSLASSFPFQHLRRLHHTTKEGRPEIHYNLWTLDPGNLQFSNISRCIKIDGWVANSFLLNQVVHFTRSQCTQVPFIQVSGGCSCPDFALNHRLFIALGRKTPRVQQIITNSLFEMHLCE